MLRTRCTPSDLMAPRREFSMHECSGCIRSHRNDPDRALAIYEAHRRPATSAIVLANRGLGPEMPMRLVHERAPEGFDHINDVISPEETLRSPTAIDEPLAQARSSFKRHVPYRRQLCRNAAVAVTSLPAYRPKASHSSSVHGARNWVVTKSDVHRTMSIQGRSALITSVNAIPAK